MSEFSCKKCIHLSNYPSSAFLFSFLSPCSSFTPNAEFIYSDVFLAFCDDVGKDHEAASREDPPANFAAGIFLCKSGFGNAVKSVGPT